MVLGAPPIPPLTTPHNPPPPLPPGLETLFLLKGRDFSTIWDSRLSCPSSGDRGFGGTGATPSPTKYWGLDRPGGQGNLTQTQVDVEGTDSLRDPNLSPLDPKAWERWLIVDSLNPFKESERPGVKGVTCPPRLLGTDRLQ